MAYAHDASTYDQKRGLLKAPEMPPLEGMESPIKKYNIHLPIHHQNLTKYAWQTYHYTRGIAVPILTPDQRLGVARSYFLSCGDKWKKIQAWTPSLY